jgi:hypothetical protein
MKKVWRYSVITLVVIVGIILAVLGALGYLTPKSSSPSGTPTNPAIPISPGIFLTNIQPIWGCSGSSPTFGGLEFNLSTTCTSPTCENVITAEYKYARGVDSEVRSVGASGWYHVPPSNSNEIPLSAKLQLTTVNNGVTKVQGSYDVNIPTPPSC